MNDPMTAIASKPDAANAAERSIVRPVGFFLALVLAVASVVQIWQFGQRMTGLDFYQFWLIGTELRQGTAKHIYGDPERRAYGEKWLQKSEHEPGSRLHRVARRRTQLETYSTPWLYTVFALMSTGDYERDYGTFTGVSLVASLSAMIGLCRMFRISWTVSLLVVAFFFSCFQPLRSDVAVGNINQLQLAGIALYMATQDQRLGRLRYLMGGFLFGLMVAFKPNIAFAVVLLGLLWLVNRQWKKALHHGLGLIAGVAMAVGVSSVAFRTTDCWAEWLSSLSELLSLESLSVEAGNFSLSALIRYCIGREYHAEVLHVMTLSATALMVILLSPRRSVSSEQDRANDLSVIGIGIITTLLVSRLAWLHYFELLIPAAIQSLAFVIARSRHWRSRTFDGLITATALVFIAMIPIKSVVTFHDFTVPVSLCLMGTVLLAVQLLRQMSSSDFARTAQYASRL